ncbi:MAG: hydroxyacid dehydrogenase [Alphaproteobacteria bacterium RIFCSPHIGHO2_02_FULL_46_13]|nr:MAG: hydroxyacid dehydrogenase [Alphaproteobacteria bacterium RIFCSPHIGHO2_02_FULL_46_13]
MTKTAAYAAQSKTSPLAPFSIERRAPTEHDVAIEIAYCGICHSDIHEARNEWGGSVYPLVPGHEIIGRVHAVGSSVTKYKIGDLVGVGCLVDSCRHCSSCDEGLEQYCENGWTGTYNSEDKKYGGRTYGGYSERITVDENFVVRIPDNLDTAAAAPLLCAGITLYSPLKHWKVEAGQKVGIVGLGGLGHMGVKLASAMGAHVVMITTSPSKAEDAKRLGAAEVLISKDADAMAKAANSFDLIIDTIPVGHDLNLYINLLKRDKTLVVVGAIEPLDPMHGALLIMKRRHVAGSVIGGIAETQEMLDFCGKHNITCDIELIDADYINTAYDRMIKSDVKYRFVMDIASLKNQKAA